MRTVITYLDKSKNRTTKENAWTVMMQVFNDAGNLQRTGYSIGEAQAKAVQSSATDVLTIRDETSGKICRFNKPIVKIGRDNGCDIIFNQKEDKKKIDKVHAVFELRQGVWHVMDTSKAGVWLNGQKIPARTPIAVKIGDSLDFGQHRRMKLE